MRYFFLELDINGHYSYVTRPRIRTRNYPLEDLYEFITDKQMRWIKETEDENDPKKVIIWSEWNIKNALDETVFGAHEDYSKYEEYFKYLDRYGQYGLKRFKEVPAIRIFKDNLEFLEQQWREIRKRKPKYLIFREHDNGFVDILEKDELTEEDKAIIEREHKIYLNYLKRWDAYCKTHPEKRSQFWRSPADDEYESDFALYDPIDEQGVDE